MTVDGVGSADGLLEFVASGLLVTVDAGSLKRHKLSITISGNQHMKDVNERWFEAAGLISLVVELLIDITPASDLDHLFVTEPRDEA